MVDFSDFFLFFLRAHTHLLILGFSEVFGVYRAWIVYILNVLQSAFAYTNIEIYFAEPRPDSILPTNTTY